MAEDAHAAVRSPRWRPRSLQSHKMPPSCSQNPESNPNLPVHPSEDIPRGVAVPKTTRGGSPPRPGSGKEGAPRCVSAVGRRSWELNLRPRATCKSHQGAGGRPGVTLPSSWPPECQMLLPRDGFLW